MTTVIRMRRQDDPEAIIAACPNCRATVDGVCDDHAPLIHRRRRGPA